MVSVVMRLFFFFFKQKSAYERRISDWSSDVCSSDLPHNVPFNEKLYFGKLSFQAGDANLFELSLRYRDEDSISPGSSTSAPNFSTNLTNDETRADLRYQFSSLNWLHDATLTFAAAAYNTIGIAPCRARVCPHV